MQKFIKFGLTLSLLAASFSYANNASALVFTPILPGDIILSLPPVAVYQSPDMGERVVMPATTNSKRTIAVMFDSNIEFVGSTSDAVQVFNMNTGTQITLDSVTINKNMLYIYSTSFVHDSTDGIRFHVNIAANQIRKAGGGAVMTESLGWDFTLANGIDTMFPLPLHESLPKITVTKSLITSGTLTFLTSADQFVTYRITVANQSEGYSVNNIKVYDVLPPGFIYDSLSFGTGVSESGSHNLTFTIPADLGSGASKVFDFKVKVPNSVADGTYDNAAIATANFTPTGLHSDLYTTHTISSFFDNTGSDENVSVHHTTLTILPSLLPTLSPLPTATILPTPTVAPGTGFSHPSSDPLTCLHLNGAAAINFSDVSASMIEAPYVSFLNTTTFYTNPDVRLSRGYSDGTFGTNNTLTRFELTKMALGANCINYNTSPAPNHFFTDVPTDNSEVSLVIGKAKALGIVQGVGNNFYPNRAVSFGEMVKILVGSGIYFDHGTPTTSLSVSLSGITDESFRQFAEYSARMNLVNLGSGSNFPQNDFVQRRFMAQAVARYIAWLKNISLI